eukprot:scaffold73076_cov69-Phaeocystis_antarctica.AAC.1
MRSALSGSGSARSSTSTTRPGSGTGPPARLRRRSEGVPRTRRHEGRSSGKRLRTHAKIFSRPWPEGSGLPCASIGWSHSLYMLVMSPTTGEGHHGTAALRVDVVHGHVDRRRRGVVVAHCRIQPQSRRVDEPGVARRQGRC